MVTATEFTGRSMAVDDIHYEETLHGVGRRERP